MFCFRGLFLLHEVPNPSSCARSATPGLGPLLEPLYHQPSPTPGQETQEVKFSDSESFCGGTSSKLPDSTVDMDPPAEEAKQEEKVQHGQPLNYLYLNS